MSFMKKVKHVVFDNKVISKLYEGIRTVREFYCEYLFFKKHNSYSKEQTKGTISYNMIRKVHTLEKGMSNPNPRPFGEKNIKEIISLIQQYELTKEKSNFSYNMAISGLNEYLKFYEKKGWTNEKTYVMVKRALENRFCEEKVDVGAKVYGLETLNGGKEFDYSSFLSSRHSVRTFMAKNVEEDDIQNAIRMAILTPSACNRQMIKVYHFRKEEDNLYIANNVQGISGFDKDNTRFLVVTFDENAFYFVGERNQGWFNSGLFSCNLINALHNKGIGSCILQFGNSSNEEKAIKNRLEIPKPERIAAIIAYGYYADSTLVPCSYRKSIGEVMISK